MKEIKVVNFPVAWTGRRPNIQEKCDKALASLQSLTGEGWNLTHITSSTMNDIMYVYHTFEREVKE